MLDRKLQFWFYPEPTGDVGRDRNARTLQFACLLYAFAFALVAVLDAIARERVELPILVMAVVALVAAAAMNRAGMSAWAARIAILAGLLTAILLVLEARDGFRSHAMLVFPGLLLISMTLLDRKSYVTTAGIVLLAVAALGIAERHGLTGAIPGIRTPTSYESIFYVDLTLAVFAMIGSRIVSDAQRNVFDLRASVERLSVANLELTKAAEALRRSESLARARTAELQAIMDAAPAVILVANDAEYSHVGGNRTAYALMRQKPGTNLSMAAPDGERPTNRRVMQDGIEISLNEMPLHKAAFTAQPFRNYDLEVVFEDGTSIDLLGNVEPIPDEKGVPRGAVAVLSDITERKRAEEALRESEQRLISIYNTVRDVIFHLAVEPEGQFRFVSVNAAFLRVTGLSLETVVGKTVNEVILEPSLTMVLGKYRQAVEEKTVVLWEETSDYPTGRLTGEGSVAPVVDNKGRCTHLIGSVHDITERTRAETALRASEERFRATFYQAAVGMAQTGLDGKWLLLNDRLSEILGYTQAELRGKNFLEITHSDDREMSLAGVRQLLAGNISSWSTEKRYVRKDGAIVWARLCVSLVRDQDNRPQYFIAVVEDITEQKLVEERLLASEAQLMKAQHLAKVGSWKRHIKSDTIHWSEEMLRILGLANGAPSNLPTFLSYVHPKDREKILEIDENVRSSIPPVEVEYRIIRPDGETRFVRSIVEGIRDDQGVPVWITGATQDITEQVKARELLRESEGHLKNAVRLAHVGYWQWDPQTNRVSGSDEMFRIFGKPQNYTPSYDDLLQTVIPEDRERVARWASDCLAEKRGNDIEYQIVWPNGDLRTVSCISELSLEEEGRPTRLFGACQDVTDQRQAEVSMRRSLDEIAHLNRVAALGEMVTSLAHELNQPLAAILSNAEAAGQFLNRESPNLARVRGCLTAIVADDERAAGVIKRLRALLKKDHSQASLIDLNEVVSDALRLVNTDAMLRETRVRIEAHPKLPPVLGDRVQFCQVVLNLLLNGLHAAAEQPPVERWVLVRTAEADGGGVELTVEDSGKGIAESDLARVFEPFFTTKREGLGMGLSISQSIVEAHGGRIWAQNSAGCGAIFHCVLPVAQ